MSSVRSYRDLKVWQESMKMVDSVYSLTDHFPKVERFGLSSQLQRSAVSVPANIAEGQGRQSTKEFCHHLSIARGSLFELETELQIAVQRNYVSREDVAEIWRSFNEIGKMLNGLLRALQRRVPKSTRSAPANH